SPGWTTRAAAPPGARVSVWPSPRRSSRRTAVASSSNPARAALGSSSVSPRTHDAPAVRAVGHDREMTNSRTVALGLILSLFAFVGAAEPDSSQEPAGRLTTRESAAAPRLGAGP